MISSIELRSMVELLLLSDKRIHLSTIIDKSGSIMAESKKSRNVFTDEELTRMSLQIVMEYFGSRNWNEKTGPLYYSVSRYENWLVVAIPFDRDHMILLVFDHDAIDIHQIIEKKIIPATKRLFKTSLVSVH